MSRDKKEYTSKEKSLLIKLFENGVQIPIIAQQLNCTPANVKYFVKNENLKRPMKKRVYWNTQTFVNEMKNINKNIEILGEYISSKTPIKVRCKKDGYIWETTPDRLLQGKGCPVCAGSIVVKGINDLWTTDPDIAIYLKYPEDGYKYMRGSYIKTIWVCPFCGRESLISVREICNGRSICKHCTKDISYPERVFRIVLDELNINYEPEYKPEWISPRRYDFYIIDKNIIVEINGAQHYCEHSFAGDMPLQKRIEIDKYKEQMAYSNNISDVIYLDASHSNIDYIKDSIYSNKNLCNNIDFSSISWEKVEYFARQYSTYLIYKFIICNSSKKDIKDIKDVVMNKFCVTEEIYDKCIMLANDKLNNLTS